MSLGPRARGSRRVPEPDAHASAAPAARRRPSRALLVATALAVIAACQRSSGPTTAHRSPTPLDASTTGTITGHVRFSGAKPAPRRVQVTSDPTCVAAHRDGLDVDDVRGDDGVLADAFVYVARGLGDRVFAVPETPVVVDQRGCVFDPPVAGAQVGQPIAFVNGDDTLHNVHGTPTKSSAWNFGLAVRGARRTITVDHPEVPVGVQCDVHPWMHAAVAVVDHPYFTVTAEDGAFTLARVPHGHYTLAAWHPQLGTRERDIEVTAGVTTNVDLTFAP